MIFHPGTEFVAAAARTGIFRVLFITCAALCMQPRDASAASDAAVEAGRDALKSGRPYPWYDPAKDDVRSIELPKPKAPRTTSLNFGGGISEALGSGLQMLVYVLLAVGLCVLVYFLIAAFLARENGPASTGAGSARPAVAEQARVEELPFKLNKGTDDLLGEARRSYEQGKYSEAILYLFSYQLLEMDRGQIIRLTKGKTNRQYLREISPRRALQSLMAQTMVAFEDVFFGNHALDRQRFETCWSQVDEFKTLVLKGTA